VKKLDVIAQNHNRFRNQGVEIVQKLSILCKHRNQCRLVYRVNYEVKCIFLFAELSGGLSCYILTHCCQIVSSVIAKSCTSHDTNYKILVAKRNGKNIRWLSRLTENSEAEKVRRVVNDKKLTPC
jgi:hypothetical protein